VVRSKRSARRAPAGERIDGYPRPAVTVDLVIFTVLDADLKILLVRRGEPPFRGAWALPGGFVRVGRGDDQGEDLEAAAHRELMEETGLPEGRIFLEQLQAFGRAGRDPRLRVITVAYYALVRPDLVPLVRAGSDAADARWLSVAAETAALELAFDHRAILDAALVRLRDTIDRTPIAFELVPPTFTIAELREVHEAIKGAGYDPGNFRRRFVRMLADGVISQAPGRRHTATKPSRVYRFERTAAATRRRGRRTAEP
jgi:8-oxo-dGTP diphosphatase